MLVQKLHTSNFNVLLKRFTAFTGIVFMLLVYGGFLQKPLKAQTVASYSFTQAAGTFSTIVGGTGTVNVGTTLVDDTNFGTYSIGFNFTYAGIVYTTFGIQANGFIKLGGVPASSYTTIVNATNTNAIAAFNADLYSAATGARLDYQLSGTAPNRVLTVQWTNWGFYSTGLNEATFQIKLTETSNTVRVIYGSCPGTTAKTLQVGLVGNTTSDVNTRTTTTNWSATTAGTSASTCTFSSTVKPTSGLTYTWTPAAPSYCTTGLYTTGCSIGDNIQNISISNLNQTATGCTGGTGIANFTGTTVNFNQNTSYPFTITCDYSSSEYTGWWIDFNDNASFGDAGEFIGSSGPGGGTITGTVTIPAGATLGNHRMRVRLVYLTAQSLTTSCTSYTYGETHDYTANIAAASSYCTTGLYTTGCSSGDNIQNISISNLNQTATGCTGGTGIANFTGTTVNFNQNTSYPFTITCDYTSSEYTGWWIDFNDNTSFGDAGEFIGSSGPGGGTITGTVTIPAGATLGNHRMRVRLVYASAQSLTTSCTSYTFGETHDYTANIAAAPSCTPPTGVAASSVTSSSATISWTAASPAPSSGYQWEVRTSGAAGSGATGLAASGSTGAGVVSASVSGLSQLTTYSIYVRSNCGSSVFSSWTSAVNFTTTCGGTTCNYTFRLTDSYGDGWNGATMQVRFGTTVIATLGTTFTTGTVLDVPVNMCSGATYNLFYVGSGTYPAEVGIQILDFSGGVIYSLAAGAGTMGTQLTSWVVNCTPPSPPSCTTNISPSNGQTGVSSGGTTLSWSAVSGATGYDVYFGTTSPAPTLVASNQAGTTYATGALSALTTYYWRIVPRNSGGTATGCANWSFTTNCNTLVPYSGNNSVTTCSCLIQDHAGSGVYSAFANGYTVIYPSNPSQAVQLTGTYDIESCCDDIYIYNGVGTGGTLLGNFFGTGSLPGTIVSSGPNIPLTVYFTSDGSVQYTGFDFTVSCVTPPTPAYRSSWISMNTGSSTWCAGETRNISVTVQNTGSSTWTNASPDINIGVKWNADADYFIRVDANNLAPNATQTYNFTVTAPLTTGTNNLTFDVVNEGNCWFANNSGACGPGNVVFTSSPITISAGPTANAGPDVSVCPGGSVQIGVAGGGGSGSATFNYSGSGSDCSNFVIGGTTSGMPAGATITSIVYNATIGTYCTSWYDWEFLVNGSFITSGCNSTGNIYNGLNGAAANGQLLQLRSSDNDVYCDFVTLTFDVTVNYTVPVTTYSWSPTTGLSNPNISNPTASPSVTTTYTLTATQNGCSATDQVVVTLTSPPPISISPGAVTICSGAPTTLSVSGVSGGASLANVLSAINTNSAALISSIPTPSGFTMDLGVNSNNISDGCSDMYDGGNFINTNLASQIFYSDNTVTANAGAFGSGGQYFTRYLGPGGCQAGPATLFFWAADINGLSSVSITGNNGADGSGTQDVATFTVSAGGTTYNCFLKRVYNAGDPSINQLFLIPQPNSATQSIGSSTDDTQQTISGLNGVTRIYYLLYAGASGAFINNAQAQSIAQTFVNILPSGGAPSYLWSTSATTPTITVSPTSTTAYSVSVTQSGCTSTASSLVTVGSGVSSVAPTGITGNTAICIGGSTTLTVSGGTAGTGAVAEWFTGSCGGTFIGTGNSILVSPSTTTTYYVRYSGTCNTTTCASVAVTVNTTPPTANAGPDVSICGGASTTIGIAGGELLPITVTISGTGYLDETSWTVTNSAAQVVGSGGPYGFGTTNTVTVNNTSPPLTFFLETQGLINDNVANYTIVCNGSTIFSGTLLGGQQVSIPNINCGGSVTYSWSPTTGLSNPNISNPIASPSGTTTYTLTATQNGCSATDQVVV
ncbi:hypothetical protein C7N43_00940, partial [Sphingobacteriales bacterium UPWRP_1]